MGQEEKQLLLQDLCARLPYHPKCVCYWKEKPQNGTEGYVTELTTYELDQFMDADKFDDIPIREIKPYLRPMSSMTEEERDEVEEISHRWFYINEDGEIFPMGRFTDSGEFEDAILPTFEYFLKNHIDYRGLIEKGLALEAPEGMYEI